MVRELRRIIAERAGLADDSTADADAEPVSTSLPGEPPSEPIGFGTHGERGLRALDRGA